jgi:HEAT repeat protein
VQILYLPLADFIKKRVKVFMDVTVERLGDAAAATLILFLSFVLGRGEITLLSYFAVGLILIWITIVLTAQRGYVDTLRMGLAYREVSLATTRIDVTDKATLEIILTHLDGKDEPSVLFALDLAEKFDPKLVVARLPRGLLNHPSAEVRRRALTLMAASLDANVLATVFELLTTESTQVRSEAVNTVATVLKEAAVPAIRPFLKSPEAQTRRAAIRLMLQSSDARTRQEALADFHELMKDCSPGGEQNRIEAARLMGELVEPEFSNHLSRLITDDPSPAVIQEAMAAAARGKYSRVIPDILPRLSSAATKTAAREALIQYGEMAVKELRGALFDNRVSRDIRLNIPQTLSKIQAQSAMDALQGGLLDEDRSIRFNVILAIEEMARCFPDLKVDRQIIESAVMSDALLYSQRFAVFSVLFGEQEKSSGHGESLLYFALIDSMERVKERVMWLLALLYPAEDIRRAWLALNSPNPLQRARATEFLDNLLAGELKNHVFPLYSDSQPDQRLRMALASLEIDAIDIDSALRMLLTQDDRWLKAATVWEVGIRKLFRFRNLISKLVDSEDAVLRETASKVIQRI